MGERVFVYIEWQTTKVISPNRPAAGREFRSRRGSWTLEVSACPVFYGADPKELKA